MSDKTTYESLDNRIAPEALTEDHTKGLAVVDGHAVKSQEDYEDPNRLYDMLIARIRKYHPSTDVSMIEKAYKSGGKGAWRSAQEIRRTIYHPSFVGSDHSG